MKSVLIVMAAVLLLAACAGGGARVDSNGKGVQGRVSGTLMRF
jgi:hypothetical protein